MIKMKEKNKARKGVCMESLKYRERREGRFHQFDRREEENYTGIWVKRIPGSKGESKCYVLSAPGMF